MIRPRRRIRVPTNSLDDPHPSLIASSAPSRKRRSSVMLQYFGRTTNARILSFIIICAVAWICLAVQQIVPTPRIAFGKHDRHQLSPPAFVVNASCEKTQPLKTTKLSQTLFPVSNPEKTGSWIGENHKMLQALFRCLELSNCGRNQNKVILLGSYHFRGAFWGWVGGEDVWARSTIQALRDMGYTFLFAFNMERTVQLYHMMPDLVKAIIVEGPDAYACFEDDQDCILSGRNPDGIPAWKIFSFHFWTHPDNPLGRNWTLSPEEYILEGFTPNTYLGYSVEPSCLSQPFVEPDEREDQAYVMAKWMAYLEDGAWPLHFYEAVSNTTGLQFIIGAKDDDRHSILPPGLTNHGLMTQSVFLDTLSKSLLLVGVGRPATSPTPYDALCLGVPFINPILDWDRDDPQDRSKWSAQHGMLKLLDPPYVYNVFKDDLDGFVEAVDNAILNPIGRYVLNRMRMSSVTSRLRTILERDWKKEAADLLARRKATGEGPIFTL